MKSFLSQEELHVQLQVGDFVLSTQKQIAKDFNSSGIVFPPDFHTTPLIYNDILDVVENRLNEIMRQGETQLLQLLYQIDIPQSSFLDLLNDEEFLSKLSAMIIRREAYKVYLRSKF